MRRILLAAAAEIAAMLLLFTAFIRIGTYLSTDHLRSGIVTGIRYDAGNPYETELTLFDRKIRHVHRPEATYLLEIRDGDRTDVWTVSREMALKYSVGDYVEK